MNNRIRRCSHEVTSTIDSSLSRLASRRSGRWGATTCLTLLVALASAQIACADPTWVADLSISDPAGFATAARTLEIARGDDELLHMSLAQVQLPTTIPLTSHRPGATWALAIRARDDQGRMVAVAHAVVRFPTLLARWSVRAQLSFVCRSDAECQNGVFCDGEELCLIGVCVPGRAACSDPPADCVLLTCVEELAQCSVSVDHHLCLPVADEDGQLEQTYCDGSVGCVRGSACREDLDCRDDSVCNGDERCATGRCVAGHPVVADDGNPCTLDACVEREGVLNLAAASLEGQACGSLDPGHERHLCLSGICSSSRCGDGYLDETREQCEDGNDNPNDGCAACRFTAWEPTVLVGWGESGGDLREVVLKWPLRTSVDRRGNLLIADFFGHRVLMVNPSNHLVTILAGTGRGGFAGDGGPANRAQLYYPADVVADGRDQVFVVDAGNHRVRRIDVRGQISTVAGTGAAGFSGDGSAATRADFRWPMGVDVDGRGDLVVADWGNRRVRRIGTDGLVHTVAGDGHPGFSAEPGVATLAHLAGPYGVRLDHRGGFFVADLGSNTIRHVDADGLLTTTAGNGVGGYAGDGGPATQAMLRSPSSMTFTRAGELLIADYGNSCIRRVDVDGVITTLAGTGARGFSGDGGLATAAQLYSAADVTADSHGTVYITDSGNFRVRTVAADGTIESLIGAPSQALGDGKSAAEMEMQWPYGLAVSPSTGVVLIADSEHYRVRCITTEGVAMTVAGTGRPAYDGDGGPATQASLMYPSGVTADATGNFYIADWRAHVVRKVDAAGIITTVAGTGVAGILGDNGPATTAQLYGPWHVAADVQGNLYIADYFNNAIRRVDASGRLTTVAGTLGREGFGGDGGPAERGLLRRPSGVVVAGDGRVFIADYGNHRIRMVDTQGKLFTIAGTGVAGQGGEGGPAIQAQLQGPHGVAVDAVGNLLVTEYVGNRLLKVDVAGNLWRVGGRGTSGLSGDYGPAVSATLAAPDGVAITTDGQALVSDSGNHRIRRIDTSGVITTFAGPIRTKGDGPLAASRLDNPQALARGLTADSQAAWLIADGAGGTMRALLWDADWLGTLAGYPGGLAGPSEVALHARLFADAAGVAMDVGRSVLYVAERQGHTIRHIDMLAAMPVVSTAAGMYGRSGYRDGGCAAALFAAPSGLVFDDVARILYVADAGNHVVRAVAVEAGTVSTIAGIPQEYGFQGDGGLATEAWLQAPEALVLGNDGSLYVADTGNHRVRRIDENGLIRTVLGDGTPASSGSRGLAREMPLDSPKGLAVDAFGNLFVSSSSSVRLVTAGSDGIASADDEAITIYGLLPHDEFPESQTRCLTGLAVLAQLDDPSSQVLVLDACAGLVIKLVRTAR